MIVLERDQDGLARWGIGKGITAVNEPLGDYSVMGEPLSATGVAVL